MELEKSILSPSIIFGPPLAQVTHSGCSFVCLFVSAACLCAPRPPRSDPMDEPVGGLCANLTVQVALIADGGHRDGQRCCLRAPLVSANAKTGRALISFICPCVCLLAERISRNFNCPLVRSSDWPTSSDDERMPALRVGFSSRQRERLFAFARAPTRRNRRRRPISPNWIAFLWACSRATTTRGQHQRA